MLRKWFLRFGVVYFILYGPRFFLSAISYRIGPDHFIGKIVGAYANAVLAVGEWVGREIFAVDRDVWHAEGFHLMGADTGGGDRIGSWIIVLVNVVLAVVLASIWSLIQRRNHGHPLLARILMHTCRLYLSVIMCFYGLIKVVPSQFRFPSLEKMLTEYGDEPRIRVIWNFMGTSQVYVMFSGWMEMTAGLLLLFRRTQTLGALMAVGALTNIVAMNYAYMITVKIHSSHFLFIALGLVLADWRRLANIFVFNRPTARIEVPYPKWAQAGSVLVKLTAMGFALNFLAGTSVRSFLSQDEMTAPMPLRGMFDVQSIVVNDEPVPLLRSDETLWRNLLIEWPSFASVRMMDDHFERYMLAVDAKAKSLTLSSFGQTQPYAEFSYELDDNGQLLLRGTLDGRYTEITLTQRTTEDYFLTSRGFNWVQDQPLNQ